MGGGLGSMPYDGLGDGLGDWLGGGLAGAGTGVGVAATTPFSAPQTTLEPRASRTTAARP
jgi:hypothetical protein